MNKTPGPRFPARLLVVLEAWPGWGLGAGTCLFQLVQQFVEYSVVGPPDIVRHLCTPTRPRFHLKYHKVSPKQCIRTQGYIMYSLPDDLRDP